MTTLIFEVQGLNQSYANSRFGLKDISLKIDSGEIVGLIGKNGAGKTTLLETLANLEKKASGACYYKGCLVNRSFYQNSLGYLPTELNLYEYLTLKENLSFIFDVRDQSYNESWVNEMLDAFELDESLEVPLVELSKGMRLKFNLIVTLIHQPDILLLDEPFEGIDPAQAIVLKQILKNQAQLGKGILLSSHILSYIVDICDRIYFIKEGQLLTELTAPSTMTITDIEKLFY